MRNDIDRNKIGRYALLGIVAGAVVGLGVANKIEETFPIVNDFLRYANYISFSLLGASFFGRAGYREGLNHSPYVVRD